MSSQNRGENSAFYVYYGGSGDKRTALIEDDEMEDGQEHEFYPQIEASSKQG